MYKLTKIPGTQVVELSDSESGLVLAKSEHLLLSGDIPSRIQTKLEILIDKANVAESMERLTIISHTYGIGKHPVVTLNYHNGEQNIDYYPVDNKIDIELFTRIGEAIKKGYRIEYIDNPTVGDLK